MNSIGKNSIAQKNDPAVVYKETIERYKGYLRNVKWFGNSVYEWLNTFDWPAEGFSFTWSFSDYSNSVTILIAPPDSVREDEEIMRKARRICISICGGEMRREFNSFNGTISWVGVGTNVSVQLTHADALSPQCRRVRRTVTEDRYDLVCNEAEANVVVND